MNKKELLECIDQLLCETKEDEACTKQPLEQMYVIGKQNGLLWAKNFIIYLSEEDENDN